MGSVRRTPHREKTAFAKCWRQTRSRSGWRLQVVCGEVATDEGVRADGGQVTLEMGHPCHTKETEL